jgi:hypothetical protein
VASADGADIQLESAVDFLRQRAGEAAVATPAAMLAPADSTDQRSSAAEIELRTMSAPSQQEPAELAPITILDSEEQVANDRPGLI